MACKWHKDGGVMSIMFANIDIFKAKFKLYGIYTVPFMERDEEEGILTMFAKQDIVLGNGSDTILNLSGITDLMYDAEMERLDNEQPTDMFVAVKQNVWFINVKQNKTFSDVYDDDIIISGGGQIVETDGETGGIVYHAMIKAKVKYSECSLNPTDGFAFSQNFKTSKETYLDLGNSFLSFHNTCDGKAHVDVSTGKYISYNNKNISLELE